MRRLQIVMILAVMALVLVGCGRFSGRIESIPTDEQREAAAQQAEETPTPEEEAVEATEEQPSETPTEEGAATEEPGEVETPEETAEVEEATPTEEAGASPEGQENEPETIPVEPVVIDMAAAPNMTLDEGWEQVYSLEAGYPFELTITEEQLKTALIANTDLPNISDIHVRLDNGLITITFTIQLERVSPQAQIILVPSVADGDVVLTVQSVTVGAFSLPEEIVDEISAGLQMAMNGAREEIASEYPVRADVTSVTVDDGIMTISGTLVPK